MRGRKPLPVAISPADSLVLHWIARGEGVPWFQVQRARIVLAIAGGQRTATVAATIRCDEATVWRTCRRYEDGGLSGLLADARRSDRSLQVRGQAGHSRSTG
jgi:Winged helix-turn helix